MLNIYYVCFLCILKQINEFQLNKDLSYKRWYMPTSLYFERVSPWMAAHMFQFLNPLLDFGHDLIK